MKIAGKFDAAVAKANAALTELMEHDPAYGSAMRAAGLRPWTADWPQRLTRAMWAATAPVATWNRWRGPATAPRPALADALRLPRPTVSSHVATLAGQLAAFAPGAAPAAAAPPAQAPPATTQEVDPLGLPAEADPLDLPADAPLTADERRRRAKAAYAAMGIR